jgi:putative ABC transport system substrate-binding protein
MKRKALLVPGLNRRKFLFAASALTLSRGGYSQPPKKAYRIGLVLTTSPIAEMLGPEPAHPRIRAFIRELRRLGYSEGGNLILDRRSAEGKFERFGDILAELLRLKPDLLVTLGGPMTLAAKKLTDTVPIIAVGVSDPIGTGVVTSLARPGGNITGISANTGPEFAAKRLELLKDAVPGITTVAYLGLKTDWDSSEGLAARRAAQALGITLFFAEARPKDYSGGLALVRSQRPGAVLVGGQFPNWVNREVIVEALNAMRLPNIHAYSEAAEIGGLMSYTTFADDTWLRVAAYVDKILKGAKPGDLPIELPARFELVVNVKAAKAMGIAIPQSFLLRADRVIE